MGAKRLKSHANIKINKSLLVFCYFYHLFNRMFKHKIFYYIFISTGLRTKDKSAKTTVQKSKLFSLLPYIFDSQQLTLPDH